MNVGRVGFKNSKPILAPPHGAMLKFLPIPAAWPLRGGENPREVKWGGAGQNWHPYIRLVSIFGFFLFFSNIQPDYCTAVWRPFEVQFSSNFIFTEISGCLVSNGSNLIRFGATIVEISHFEGRWRKAEKFWTSSLEKFISFNLEPILLSPFGEN